MAPLIGVIGAGVSGLATALCLSREGYSVRVFSAPQERRPTSPVAAAFWYPYAVSLEPQAEQELAAPTFRFLIEEALVDSTRSGCHIVEGAEYFDKQAGDPFDPWWATQLPETNFRHVQANELAIINDCVSANSKLRGDFCKGWRYHLPAVQMNLFLPWLRGKAEDSNAEFIDNRLIGAIPELLSQDFCRYDAVVNCSGIWATHLTRDKKLYALPGIVVRVPREYAGDHLIFIERGAYDTLPIYIVPHPTFAVLGGTAYETHNRNHDGRPWPAMDHGQSNPDRKIIFNIIERCAAFSPRLKDLLNSYDEFLEGEMIVPLLGLRPRRRDAGPRIERDAHFRECPLIHNYGHGGAGITLCWGSALKVLRIVQESCPVSAGKVDGDSAPGTLART